MMLNDAQIRIVRVHNRCYKCRHRMRSSEYQGPVDVGRLLHGSFGLSRAEKGVTMY